MVAKNFILIGANSEFAATFADKLIKNNHKVYGVSREFIPYLTRAAAATGIDALFMEVHDDPPNALSDSNTVLDIKYLEVVLAQAKVIHETRLELKYKWGEDHVHQE